MRIIDETLCFMVMRKFDGNPVLQHSWLKYSVNTVSSFLPQKGFSEILICYGISLHKLRLMQFLFQGFGSSVACSRVSL